MQGPLLPCPALPQHTLQIAARHDLSTGYPDPVSHDPGRPRSDGYWSAFSVRAGSLTSLQVTVTITSAAAAPAVWLEDGAGGRSREGGVAGAGSSGAAELLPGLGLESALLTLSYGAYGAHGGWAVGWEQRQRGAPQPHLSGLEPRCMAQVLCGS